MKAQIVSFHCVLKNKFGKVISSTFNNEVINQGGGPSVLKGLADGLQGLKKGEKRKISLSASEAYGFYDPKKVIRCARQDLGSDQRLRCGDQVMIEVEGDKAPAYLRVIEVRGDQITLDGNHPLAGQDLIFEIEATEAREATPDEIRRAFSDAEEAAFLH